MYTKKWISLSVRVKLRQSVIEISSRVENKTNDAK